MAFYLKRERYLKDPILPETAVTFDVEVSKSYSDPSGSGILEEDFIYHDVSGTAGIQPGVIEMKHRGHYLIAWEVTGIKDFPKTREHYQLRRYVDRPVNPGWEALEGENTHLKSTTSFGSVIINHDESETIKIGLFNVSNLPTDLKSTDKSNQSTLKASIIIYGLGAADGDFSSILTRLEEECCIDLAPLEARIFALEEGNKDKCLNPACTIKGQDMRLRELRELFNDFKLDLNYQSRPSQVYIINCRSPWVGLKIFCIRTGYTYNFFSGGFPGNPYFENAVTSEVVIDPNTTYIMIQANDFSHLDENGNTIYPLQYYPLTVATLNPMWANRRGFTSPGQYLGYELYDLRVDKTGIYFRYQSKTRFPAGATFEFNFSLILIPPS